MSAAASVLAKVTRDRIMVELDERYPGYGFAEHKGYITPEHTAALRELGACREHRFSYVNVAAVSGRDGRPPRSRRPAGGGPAEALFGGPAEALFGPDGALGGGPDEPMERPGPAGGTVGVALGEQPRPPAPVGEDVVMEGGER